MFVRVYDKQSDTYFKSEVYATINAGGYVRQLVIVPTDNGDFFQLIDYLDTSDPKHYKVLINTIPSDGFYDEIGQLHLKTGNVDEKLEDFAGVLDEDIRFYAYEGYLWVYEDKDFLTRLIKGEMVSTKEYANKITWLCT